jgi:hypothetical protein
MDEEKESGIIKLVEMFSIGKMQDFMTMLGEVEKTSITIEDIRDYMKRISSFEDGLGIKCPECGRNAFIIDVNTRPGNWVGGDSHSLVFCQDEMGCGWSRLDDKTPEDWVKFLKIPKILQGPRPVKFKLMCPVCQKAAGIIPVNINPATRVGGKFQSLMFCFDWQNCGYESYSRKAPGEVLRKLRRRQ